MKAIHSNTVMKKTPLHATAPDFCLSRSSIFRLAARTISSLLRFSVSALSFLFADQPGGLLPVDVDEDSAVSASAAGVATLSPRLYRVMRSGFTALTGAEARWTGVAGAGITGWKEGGGCRIVQPGHSDMVVQLFTCTYRIKTPP